MMNNEQYALEALEKEEEIIPAGYVKTRDGKIIPREKAVFALRDATLNSTGEKVLVGDRAVYRQDSKTQQLTRVDKVKMSKAEKKSAKRGKVKAMKAGIVIDDWKLSIFERHLSQAGYSYDKCTGITADTLILKVKTENVKALEVVVRSANTEASRTGAPQ